MFEKLVPCASYTKVSYDGGILSSAEHVVIPPGGGSHGQYRVGLRT